MALNITHQPQTVLVTGGAGYVGAVLVPKLIAAGHHVKVLDLYLYGDDVLDSSKGPYLTEIKGDLRDAQVVKEAVAGCDAVIHLACVSNDPSFELDPELGKTINYDAFVPLVEASKEAGVSRFIYASSSSVYGIKDEPNVTEDLIREPLTDYSRFKALCEDELERLREPGFTTLTIRPATVCGYSPRLRLDLTVNILTNHAVNKGQITVFGGNQKRPNIHIDDISQLYVDCLSLPADAIDGRTYNAGYENHTVIEIAEIVKKVVKQETGRHVDIVRTDTDDHRSYHISSQKILEEIGFAPAHTIEDAVRDLVVAFRDGKIPDPDHPRHFNVQVMKEQESLQPPASPGLESA